MHGFLGNRQLSCPVPRNPTRVNTSDLFGPRYALEQGSGGDRNPQKGETEEGTIPYKAANLKHNEAQSARVESTHKGVNRRSSEIQGTALGKCLRARRCIYWSMPAGVAQSRDAFVGSTVSTWAR